MKIIKYLIIVLLIGLSIGVLGSQFSEKSKVKSFVNKRVCLSALSPLMTKPSSLEVNAIKVFDSNLSIQAARTRIKNKSYSEDLTDSLMETLEKNYSQNIPMKESYISIDYSSEEKLYGASRSQFICVFVTNTFQNFELRSITYKNKDHTNLINLYMLRDRPERLSSSFEVDKINFVDSIEYAFSSFF